MVTTNQLLNKHKEKDCTAITSDRKYYHVDNTYVKRSLRPHEWQTSLKGVVAVPRLGAERLLNEAAALHYISANTDIPVPRLLCCFEDDEAVYLITEQVEGVELCELKEEEQRIVLEELRRHVDTLHAIRSRRVGSVDPAVPVIPPHRFLQQALRTDWAFLESDTDDYVLCHGDLSMTNVLVDPISLRIKAILDWEYSGFFPVEFDYPYFESAEFSGAVDVGSEYLERIERFFYGRRR